MHRGLFAERQGEAVGERDDRFDRTGERIGERTA